MAVITISREFGAGGKTLGRALAKKLGYTLADEEIIQKIAEKANVSKDWVKSTEQEVGGKLLKFISGLISKNYVERLIGSDRGFMDEDIFVDALREVIIQIAEEDNVIILGRAGQYILQDYPNVFHILLIASKEDRIRFMEKHYELSRPEAENIVEVYEKRRINLYKTFGREDYEQPELYHMVLNMSKLNMDKAADFIFRLVSGAAEGLLK
ncbi:MAG: cytidylate kinase-like family protein [Desulfococcaceae bacterium]|jgi:cytidylate kinase|nr:cytidylate kinase-like family protein [Desulfococcaceae bacterium]